MDYVIDTGCLRRPELLFGLHHSTDMDRFILADTAVMEVMKNNEWETTAKSSFDIISRYPKNIWLAKAPGDLMSAELATGQETLEVISPELTTGFRSLVSEIISGVDGPGMTFARANVAAAQNDLAQQQLNHAENLKGLKAAFEDVKNSLRITAYKNIPDPDQKEMVRLHRIKTLAQTAVKGLVNLEGKPADLGNALANGRGILLRYHIGFYCLGFKWAVNNGLDSFPAEKATNELMDLDHALIATYFDVIQTREASVREMRDDILQVLNSNIQLAPVQEIKSNSPQDEHAVATQGKAQTS
jgi:hypothetical protein